MTCFVQLVQIQKEMKLCNQACVLISKEKLLYFHPNSSFFRFVSDFIIIFLSFDQQVCFLMNIFGKRSDLPFFHSRVIVRKRKAWFPLRVSRILFAAKHSCTTFSALADHYLQALTCRSSGGLSANEKEENMASRDKLFSTSVA